jgi:GH43 family beta-xylosidase
MKKLNRILYFIFLFLPVSCSGEEEALPEVPKWTVTFNSNEGSYVHPVRNVKNETKIGKPIDPVKESLVFGGWYTDNETCTNAWNFGTSRVISDTVLHAKWNPETAPAGTYNNLAGMKADCADPYVLKYNGVYYLYGTGGEDGIKVYRSTNAVDWSAAAGATNGYALHKNDVWGDKWFWAPEVYFLNGKFYMFYSAEEHISVAESSSPLGPFSQQAIRKKPFHPDIKEIDTHLFIDDDGKKYLYFVRFTGGNEIWMAELNDDLYSIKEATLTRCFGSNASGWENSTVAPRARVVEGPFVLKHNGWYYLTYSANHYENPNYGVGYAVSQSPNGPWTKFAGNPILTRNALIQGVGHHSFVTLGGGCRYMVYHSHYNVNAVQPRKAGLDPYEFLPAENIHLPDTLRVYGPTTTTQTLCNNPKIENEQPN